MRVELLEPGLAVEKGRGYVGFGGADDEMFYPHVDSCCAVTVIFADGVIIGGHMGAQWPGQPGIDRAFAGGRIIALMSANQNRLQAGAVRNVICVYPGSTGWTSVVGSVLSTWYTENFMDINTAACSKGADVLVTHTEVTLRDCVTNLKKTFPIVEDLQSLTFPSS